MKVAVSVIGASHPTPEERAIAYEVGRLLGQNELTLVCGGLGGVMAAACEGAKSAGGLTVGILPMREKEPANPYVDIAIPTGMNEARNAIVALAGDAVIAIGGGFGTLSEIALALASGRLVVGLSTWDLDPARREGAPFVQAMSAGEAVSLVATHIARGR